MQLPRGTAQPLREAMKGLVDDLANDIPALFESEEYQNRRTAIEEEFGGRHEKAFSELGKKARDKQCRDPAHADGLCHRRDEGWRGDQARRLRQAAR
jgi:hypothetical protein